MIIPEYWGGSVKRALLQRGIKKILMIQDCVCILCNDGAVFCVPGKPNQLWKGPQWRSLCFNGVQSITSSPDGSVLVQIRNEESNGAPIAHVHYKGNGEFGTVHTVESGYSMSRDIVGVGLNYAFGFGCETGLEPSLMAVPLKDDAHNQTGETDRTLSKECNRPKRVVANFRDSFLVHAEDNKGVGGLYNIAQSADWKHHKKDDMKVHLTKVSTNESGGSRRRVISLRFCVALPFTGERICKM